MRTISTNMFDIYYVQEICFLIFQTNVMFLKMFSKEIRFVVFPPLDFRPK